MFKFIKNITPTHSFTILGGLTFIFFALAIITGNAFVWINLTATILTALTLFHLPIAWIIIGIIKGIKKIFNNKIY